MLFVSNIRIFILYYSTKTFKYIWRNWFDLSKPLIKYRKEEALCRSEQDLNQYVIDQQTNLNSMNHLYEWLDREIFFE